MKLLRFIVLILLSFASVQAMARESVAVINHANIAIQRPAGQLTADQVKQAIITAPAPRPWEFSAPEAGKLIATLNVRGKHTIVVDISYSATAYSIAYRDSVNMNFKAGGADGVGVIHPFYNRWVDELRDAIRLQLSKA